jgi:hypothetical protein
MDNKRNGDILKELKPESTSDNIYKYKTDGFRMLTECKQTDFPNYQNVNKPHVLRDRGGQSGSTSGLTP